MGLSRSSKRLAMGELKITGSERLAHGTRPTAAQKAVYRKQKVEGTQERADYLNSPMGLFHETVKGLPQAAKDVSGKMLETSQKIVSSLPTIGSKLKNMAKKLVVPTRRRRRPRRRPGAPRTATSTSQ